MFSVGKGKGKVHSITDHEGPEVDYRHTSTLPSTSALLGGGWSTPRPGCSTLEKDSLVIV